MFDSYTPHTKETLSQNEEIIFVGTQHILRWSKLYLVGAIAALIGYYFNMYILFLIPMCIVAYVLADTMLTEIVLTNKRFIYKQGIFSTDINELSTGHIDSIKIRQPILGKIFGFAQIIIQCEGLEAISIRFVTHPRTLHRALKQSDALPNPTFK